MAVILDESLASLLDEALASLLDEAGAQGGTTQLDAWVSMSFQVYTAVTAKATMEFEAGQPVNGEMVTLATDSWISMYPG